MLLTIISLPLSTNAMQFSYSHFKDMCQYNKHKHYKKLNGQKYEVLSFHVASNKIIKVVCWYGK